MLEIGNINATTPVHAEGRVTLEYTDGLTGRVKERVQGKNHVFPGGMMLGGLPYLLGNNSTSNPLAVYLSDYADALDPEIPLIPGNIIGYGTIGSAASGKYLGVENTAARSLGVYSGEKFHYKRQWSWTPAQVPGEIKKIGLTPRLTNAQKREYNNMLFSPLPISFAAGAQGICNYDDGLYTVLMQQQFSPNNPLVTQCTFGSPNTSEVTWHELVTIEDYYTAASSYGALCWFVDVNTRDMHLFYIYGSTETLDGKRVYKMLHAQFDAKLTQRKYQETITIGTKVPSNGFIGLNTSGVTTGILSGGVYYVPYFLDGNSLTWCTFHPGAAGEGDFSACFAKHADFPINSCYSSAPPDRFSLNSGIVLSGGRVAVALSNSGSSSLINDLFFLFKLSETKPYAIKILTHHSSLSNLFYYLYYGAIPRKVSGIDVIAAYMPPVNAGEIYADNSEMWANFSDITCYSLPADAPVRQEGQGVSVTYEIAVGY